jgi:hypothetical protein
MTDAEQKLLDAVMRDDYEAIRKFRADVARERLTPETIEAFKVAALKQFEANYLFGQAYRAAFGTGEPASEVAEPFYVEVRAIASRNGWIR